MLRTTMMTTALLAIGFSGIASAASPDTFMNGQSFYGQLADGATGARVVDLATSSYVNVKYGETVNFVSGGQTFAWTFNGLSPRSVSLAKIAPQDFSTKPLTVYIERNPLDRH